MTGNDDLRERMLVMAKSLLEATKEGKITWKTTDVDNKYIYAGTRSSVTIEHWSNRYDDDTITLSLLNHRGVVVDSLETEGVQSEEKWIPAPWNETVEDLYHAARRVAHNVDEALESMLADIERGTPSPQPAAKKVPVDPWDAGEYSDVPPF